MAGLWARVSDVLGLARPGSWFLSPGNELDDHDGFDRSMKCLACEVIPCNAEILTAEAPALLVT